MSKRRVAAIAALSGFGLLCLVLALDGRQLDDHSDFVLSLPIADCAALAPENSDSKRATEITLGWNRDGVDNAVRVTRTGIWWGNHFEEHSDWALIAASVRDFEFFGFAEGEDGRNVALSSDSAVLQFRGLRGAPTGRFTVIVDQQCSLYLRQVADGFYTWAHYTWFELDEPNEYPVSASR